MRSRSRCRRAPRRSGTRGSPCAGSPGSASSVTARRSSGAPGGDRLGRDRVPHRGRRGDAADERLEEARLDGAPRRRGRARSCSSCGRTTTGLPRIPSKLARTSCVFASASVPATTPLPCGHWSRNFASPRGGHRNPRPLDGDAARDAVALARRAGDARHRGDGERGDEQRREARRGAVIRASGTRAPRAPRRRG